MLPSVSDVRSLIEGRVTYPAWSWRVSKFLLRSDMVRVTSKVITLAKEEEKGREVMWLRELTRERR
jgi:hypothetical protein